jgi:4-methylaminobutanoate oxidase (formaldehyde-forming)
MVADVTVVRLGDDTFRVVTGAGYAASDLGWLRLHVGDGESVALDDGSDWLACLGLWGPRARDVLAAVTADDVSHAGFPLRTGRRVRIGAADVFAQRISYAGELGWELYADPADAIQVWDALAQAGHDHRLAVFGYRALESLRMEKGYRYYGTDLTAQETPLEARLDRFVAWDKPEFIGLEALRARREAGPPSTALRTLVLGTEAAAGDDDPWLPAYGGEAVRVGNEVVGRLRSVAFGYTMRRMVGYAYLPTDLGEGSELNVEVLGRDVPARVAPDVLVDPAGDRMRA